MKIDFSVSKKQRGQKRKTATLKKRIGDISAFQDTSCRYEHFHVPSGMFIQSKKMSGKIKTEFMRSWISKTEELIRQKPDSLLFCKVVSVIVFPELWESQIVVFYDEDYYLSFFKRDTEEQKWVAETEQKISLTAQNRVTTVLKEKVYTEYINDDDIGSRISRLHFFGDI